MIVTREAPGICPVCPMVDPALSGALVSRDEHGSGLDRTGSGLKRILAGSGLDRTAIFLKIGGTGLDRTENFFIVSM